VFEDGAVYHTYSTYARGLDGLWGMYQWLDRAPRGRNETASGGAATTSTASAERSFGCSTITLCLLTQLRKKVNVEIAPGREHPKRVSVERNQGPVLVPEKVVEWKLVYDPAGNGGTGAIEATLGSESVVLPLKGGDKSSRARRLTALASSPRTSAAAK